MSDMTVQEWCRECNRTHGRSARPLEIVSRQPAFWGCWITVEAQEDCGATFGSLLGDREFYLRADRLLTIRAHKRAPGVGTFIQMTTLVGLAKDWTAIPWRWAS